MCIRDSHIGIENDLEHHPGMVRAAAAFLIQLPETFKVQALNQSVNHPNWIMLCNILVNSLRKKHCLVGIIRTKMYLCHSEILMPKDTKSLGNNKAPACESRGFVRKKQKVCILTHLLYILFSQHFCKNKIYRQFILFELLQVSFIFIPSSEIGLFASPLSSDCI